MDHNLKAIIGTTHFYQKYNYNYNFSNIYKTVNSFNMSNLTPFKYTFIIYNLLTYTATMSI